MARNFIGPEMEAASPSIPQFCSRNNGKKCGLLLYNDRTFATSMSAPCVPSMLLSWVLLFAELLSDSSSIDKFGVSKSC